MLGTVATAAGTALKRRRGRRARWLRELLGIGMRQLFRLTVVEHWARRRGNSFVVEAERGYCIGGRGGALMDTV